MAGPDDKDRSADQRGLSSFDWAQWAFCLALLSMFTSLACLVVVVSD